MNLFNLDGEKGLIMSLFIWMMISRISDSEVIFS